MNVKKILILFAHPRYENSLVSKSLLHAVADLSFVKIHDLYEVYPDFNIDVRYEQQLLLSYDIIVWQHPFYWYSAPPLLKQWIDLVLTYGWAYGKNGDKLKGKWIFNAISTGGGRYVYQHGGRNRFTIPEFLRPFEQTAHLCQMNYLPPFVVHQANKATYQTCSSFAESYKNILTNLAEGSWDTNSLRNIEYLNAEDYANQ